MPQNKKLIVLIFALVFLAVACNQKQPTAGYNDGIVELRGKIVNVELAANAQKRTLGLGGRQSILENQGMLFLFDSLDYYSFWMKGMNFPIDILWLREDTVVDMVINVYPEPGKSDEELKVFNPKQKADKVLELKAGWILENGVKIGDQVKINLKKQ